jgi:hypothetical protein
MVLSSVFGSKREEVTGGWQKNYIILNFIICTLLQVLLGWSNPEARSTHVKDEKCIQHFGRKT